MYGLVNKTLQDVEKVLGESEARLQGILDNAPVGIWLVGVDKRYRFVNKTFCKAVGIAESRFLATTNLPDLLGQNIAANCMESDRECLARETPYISYETLPFVDGRQHLLEITKSKLRDSTGQVIGVIGIAIDVTERKSLEQQLSRRLRHRDIMERITQITLSSKSMEELLGSVLDEMLIVFKADRAWFLYPCDPEAPSWSVPMERTRPEWPGAFERGMVIPMTPEVAEVFREVLASTEPLPYGPATSRNIPAAVAEQFSVRSQIQMVLRPRVDSPWIIGLHHCAQARVYDEDDLLIFKDIGLRVADALSSMIVLKNLYDSEERLRAITDNASTVIFLKDMTGRYLHVNRQYEELFHVSNAAILGKTDYDIFPEDVADAVIKNDQMVVQSGQTLEVEEQVPHDDGIHIYISVKFPLRNVSGEIYAICGIATDITERKRYEEELKRSNLELEQFGFAVSHDLRQPLRMISDYLKLLQQRLAAQLYGESLEFFNFAIDGASRLDRMLADLLEYSRLGRKGEPIRWTESRAILDEALHFLQPVLTEAQARLELRGEWPRIPVSYNAILRLLQNLIGNAAKYRVAGRTPEISISSEMVNKEWRLCVADNGVGIIPGQIQRLFQIFQRLHSREAYEGTGLGLAMCRKIVEQHKGRIWAESSGEGQGSRFCVVLPVPLQEAKV